MHHPPSVELSATAALRRLRRDPIGLFEAAAQLGDVVRIPLPRYPTYLVNHPDLVWEVLATQAQRVRKSPVLQGAKRVLGEGLLTSEGALHQRQRRLIQPLFHHERIVGYADRMVEICLRAIGGWVDGQAMDLHAEMGRITLAIVGETVFDAHVGAADAAGVGTAMRDVLEHFDRLFSPLLPVWERLPLPSTMRYRRGKETFDRTIDGLIADRRRRGVAGDDLLSLLIGAGTDGEVMPDAQVRDEAITLFLAGHETTANALTWTWHLLAGVPGAESRLHEEIDGAIAGRPPMAADIPALPYLEAVLSESLRLRPPAWAIGRATSEDLELDGVRIAGGSVIITSPWLLHHDPRWWGEDADEFRPERWLEDDGGRPRHAFLPFGGGPRMCIGEAFARMEATLLIATVASQWRFEPDPAHRVELQPVITLRPRGGLPVRARARRS